MTWVGLDGYYYKPSWKFAPLFGPTIAAIRELTHAPILIAETSCRQTTNQPAKIADLFAGIRLYGLLGFVWFNSVHDKDWRLTNPAAIAAFRGGQDVPQADAVTGRSCPTYTRLPATWLRFAVKALVQSLPR